MTARTRLLAALAALAVVGVTGTAIIAPPPAHAAPTASRIAGSDRYQTAVALSKAAFPTTSTVKTVFIANGFAFADGLSIGPVAARLGGPVLLVSQTTLSAATRAELVRLAPERIVIAGGAVAVGAAVERQLRELAPVVERLAGEDRYETSALTALFGFPDGADRVYIATGAAFPDALSGGALAGADDAPLLLVRGQNPALDPSTVDLLETLAPREIVVIGGDLAVSAATANALAGAAGATVRRLAGANRYDTSAKVAAEFRRPQTVYVATGVDFPDAITASGIAARGSSPVLLTPPHCLAEPARSFVAKVAPAKLVLIGGTVALRGLVAQQHACLSLTDPKSLWLLVNKKNPLSPLRYAPAGLRQPSIARVGGATLRAEAATALEKLSAAAAAAGVGKLGNSSAYRSYATQSAIYERNLRTQGKTWTDRSSARPGHSEHQTGWSVDVVACAPGCGGIYAFGGSRTGAWVAANAHRYGFIVRYKAGYEHITGYKSEPWHLRYVGVALATDMRSGGFHTLEQYFGYPAAPSY